MMTALRQLALETVPNSSPTQPAWDIVKLNIACGGGDIVAGIALYNELRALPFELHTYNTAAVDSAAILPFMTGSRRFACEYSAFHFHQPAWTFPAKEQLNRVVVADASRWLDTYQQMMAEIVSAYTKLTSEDVRDMMDRGATMSSIQAVECGLVHEIAEPTFQRDSRWHQI
jgi:Protease subunit of ATP-dependent Clp proteases